MLTPPDITESEWKVMKLLWTKSPQPAYDLITALAENEEWHQNTVKTLLSRLLKKKAIGARKYKNLYLYHPLVSQDDCVRVETQTFLQRIFGGSVKPLLVHFLKHEKLSGAEIEELKRILNENDGRKKGSSKEKT